MTKIEDRYEIEINFTEKIPNKEIVYSIGARDTQDNSPEGRYLFVLAKKMVGDTYLLESEHEFEVNKKKSIANGLEKAKFQGYHEARSLAKKLQENLREINKGATLKIIDKTPWSDQLDLFEGEKE